MSHVFVSYSHQDSDFAQLLRNRLEQEGIKTWLALENLKAGEEWREGIDKAIRESYAMIVVISPDSDRSKYVTYEWAFAYGIGLRIIPILYKSVQGKVHPRLENLQYEDFVFATNRPWSRLVERIREIEQITLENERRDPRIEQAIQTLRQSFKPKERAEAASALGKLKAQSSTPYLLESLSDAEEEEVRIASAISLGELQYSGAVPNLFEMANRQSNSIKLRTTAIRSLGKIGDISLSNELILLLDNSDDEIVIASIKSIRDLNSPTVVEPLMHSLLKRIERLTQESISVEGGEVWDEYEDDGYPLYDNVTEATFEALKTLLTEAQVSLLFPLMEHPSPALRIRATDIVGNLKSDSATQYLLRRAVEDTDSNIRDIAIASLARLDHIGPIKDRLNDLSNNNRKVQSAAIQYFEEKFGFDGLIIALMETNSVAYWLVAERLEIVTQTEDFEKLYKCLTKKEVTVRAFAAQVLGNIGVASSCSFIKPLLYDESPVVRGLAIRAIGKLGCKGVIGSLRSRLGDQSKVFGNSDNTVSEYAAIALGKLGHISSVPYLLDIIRMPENSLKSEAAMLLGRLKYGEVVPDLREILLGDDFTSSMAALKALGYHLYGQDVNELLEELNNESFSMRGRALEKLAAIEPPFGLIAALSHHSVKSYWEIEEELKYVLPYDNPALLRSMLTDSNYRVRGFTAEALGKRPDIGCLPELVSLIRDDNSFVSGLAIRAVGRLRCNLILDILKEKVTDDRTVFDNSQIRVCDYAAIALARIGYLDKDALLKCLNIESSEVQSDVIYLLQTIENGLDHEDIQGLVINPNFSSRIAAARLSEFLASDSAKIELLVSLLHDPNTSVIIEALNTFTKLEIIPIGLNEKLVELLHHENESVVIATLRLIAKKQYTELSSDVLNILIQSNSYILSSEIEKTIARLAQRLDLKKLNDFLVQLVKDREDRLWKTSLKILEQVGDVEVARKLLGILSEVEDVWTADAIASTIAIIGNVSLEIDLQPLIEGTNIYAKSAAARIIGELHIVNLRNAILQMLNTESENNIQNALSALAEIGEPSDIPHILPHIDSENWEISTTAIHTLGRIGDGSVVESLRSRLHNPNEDFVGAVITALVVLNDHEVLPLLKELIDDVQNHSTNDRCLAIEAIGKLGTANLHSWMLLKLLDDDDSEIRFVAARALGEMSAEDSVQLLINKLDDRSSTWEGRVCDASVESLEKIGTEQALEAVRHWRERQPVEW